MAFELREGQGSLFKETLKKSEKAPDWRGTVKINGVDMELAAWDKLSRNGDHFLSVQISERRQKTEVSKQTVAEINERVQQGRAGNFADDLDDSIPFAPEWR
jgi:uncharacterized protein (DUF736 family)